MLCIYAKIIIINSQIAQKWIKVYRKLILKNIQVRIRKINEKSRIIDLSPLFFRNSLIEYFVI